MVVVGVPADQQDKARLGRLEVAADGLGIDLEVAVSGIEGVDVDHRRAVAAPFLQLHQVVHGQSVDELRVADDEVVHRAFFGRRRGHRDGGLHRWLMDGARVGGDPVALALDVERCIAHAALVALPGHRFGLEAVEPDFVRDPVRNGALPGAIMGLGVALVLDAEAVEGLNVVGEAGVAGRFQGEGVAGLAQQALGQPDGAAGIAVAVEPDFLDLLAVDFDDQVMVVARTRPVGDAPQTADSRVTSPPA